MVRYSRLSRVLAAALAMVLATHGAPRAGSGLTGAFDVYLGGLHALQMDLDGSIGEGRYDMRFELETAGFVKTFYDARIEAHATGLVEGGGLRPVQFTARTRNPKKNQDVELSWKGLAPEVRAVPDFAPKPWQVDPAEQTGTFDPLTAAAVVFGPEPPEALCGRSVEVFDGRRRYAIDLGEPEAPNASGEIACPALYRRIAGFKPKLMARMPEWPFRVFFTELAPGRWSVARAVGDTPLGTAVLLRRKPGKRS